MILIGGNFILICGTNGIGKRSLLQYSFSELPEINTINLNFSSCSSIDFVLSSFEQFCDYSKASNITKLKPKVANAFIVFQCINLSLPKKDKFGTQKVIEFLRQILEFNGFWHPKRKEWIQLESIKFEGICSPPSSLGRFEISPRFLRHTSVLYIDHLPSESIKTIIRCLLSEYESNNEICNSIFDFYCEFKNHFKCNEKLFYHVELKDIVSWVNSFKYILSQTPDLDNGNILYYEGLRIFYDRLTDEDEKEWTKTTLKSIVLKNFTDSDISLYNSEIEYTKLINNQLIPVERDSIKSQLQNMFNLFNEESQNEGLIFFDDCIQLITHIEHLLIQPGKHIHLIGLSGTGKTLIPKFISKYLNMKVFSLHVHHNYTVKDFDFDLRKVLKTSLEHPVCFIVRESDILLPVFTEKLNVLLANLYIPGLFTGDELTSLFSSIKEYAYEKGQTLENEESLLDFFIENIKANLHIIYTSNSATLDINKVEVMFPSLCSVCNLIWIGEWSDSSLYSYTKEILSEKELDYDENIISSMIEMHKSASKISSSLPQQNYVSPRFFYNFITTYCSIISEKNQKLKNEQLHLSSGLSKLHETQKEVEKMGNELSLKQAQLNEKDKLAEQKLEEILKDKQETSNKKTEAQNIQNILNEKRSIIDKDKTQAKNELAEITPIIEEAKSSVSNIKKSNLDEIRRLSQPPDVIKNTLQAVLQLLDISASTWTSIRKVINGEQFIRTILDFNAENVSQNTIKKAKHLIESSDLTYEKAQRASHCCGPLFQWLNANIKYLSILESTEPLRKKINILEEEAKEFEKQHKELTETISQFETKLKKLTSEYKILLSECEYTRRELEQIKVKLNRAEHLLLSLTNETVRWSERKEKLQAEKQTLIGNSLLSAAFTVYCGYLEQQKRMDSLIEWSHILINFNVIYSQDYQFDNFMVYPEQLIDWSAKQLPKDDLCVQNAIILTAQKQKTPFIIDPSGYAKQFLVNSYKNIVKTSFLDKMFSKHFESCLRFGTPLLIEDGEQIDPLIFPVLANEFKKSCGRTLIEFNRNDIDVSQSFKMFIITHDTDFAPTPTLSSLTTIINFSITSLSLRDQCLSRLLQFKLPDVEKHRKELHENLSKMQVDLRNLEEKMLDVFSTTKGEIIENDKLLHLLEDIKKEVTIFEQKVDETKLTLQEITNVSQQYSKVAEISTTFYFALRDMSSVNLMYQFSLDFFWSVFDTIVKKDLDANSLIEMIAKSLFINASYSLLHKHIPILGFIFGKIYLEYSKGIQIDEQLFNLAIRGSIINGENQEFMKVVNNEKCKEWLNLDVPEQEIPDDVLSLISRDNDNSAILALKVIAIMRKARADRIIPSIQLFIKESLQYNISNIPSLDLLSIASETKPNTPILLCASVGYDASELVENISSHHIESLAVGSSDSYLSIEKAVKSAAQKGNWIIVKNIHLAPIWIRKFVKTIQNIKTNPDFRIFLTSEINPKLCSNVFRLCRLIIFESASGIRANLKRFGSNEYQLSSLPKERRRLILNFLWFHAVIIERLHYESLGWSRKYEFNETDLKFSIQVGLRWIESVANGRSHISEEQFPQEAIQYLLSNCTYGGRVDIPSDKRVLSAISQILFRPNSSFGDGLLNVPEINDQTELQNWVNSLPQNESPELVWLPKNSGKFIFTQQGNELLQNILLVTVGTDLTNTRIISFAYIKGLLSKWYKELKEKKLLEFKPHSNSLISSFISDEYNSLQTTIKTILNDINEIITTINENEQMTQKQLEIINNLERSIIPESWNPHKFICNDLAIWIDDLCHRINQINRSVSSDIFGRDNINLGLLKSPETLLTVAKQTASKVNKWPVEKVKMKIIFGREEVSNEYEIIVTNIQTLNSEWRCNLLTATDEVTGEIPNLLITWTLEDNDQSGLLIPCFMTKSKKRKIFDTRLPISSTNSHLWWTIRNPSLILQPKGA